MRYRLSKQGGVLSCTVRVDPADLLDVESMIARRQEYLWSGSRTGQMEFGIQT